MPRETEETSRGERIARDVAVLVLTGAVLGLVHNGMGRGGKPPRGLEWIARPAELPTIEEARGAPPACSWEIGLEQTGDGSEPAPPCDLPEIPELAQPMQVQLPIVKQLFDARAALFVDAREPEEYREGHLPGSINLPFDLSVADPAAVEKIDVRGRPVIAYCEGFPCEVSMQVAWAFVEAGHRRVLVYMGGFGEWAGAGYPVETGEGRLLGGVSR